MRGFLIGMLHLVLGVIASFGWVTYADEAGIARRPFDFFVHGVWPLSIFVMTAALHAYWSGTRRRVKVETVSS